MKGIEKDPLSFFVTDIQKVRYILGTFEKLLYGKLLQNLVTLIYLWRENKFRGLFYSGRHQLNTNFSKFSTKNKEKSNLD